MLESCAARQLRAALRKQRTVTCALSGGIDSVVLLDVLRRVAPGLGLEIAAVHVNHGLSPNADRWAEFCARHCARRRIPFTAVRVDVPREGGNVEARAREARYAALSRCARGLIAIAHHMDDQAETVLLQLLRGAGVHGLRGMPVERSVSGGTLGFEVLPERRIVRPLLGIGRSEIERYAKRRRLTWIVDESNSAERFSRNFLRLRVLPALEHKFPGCRSALVRCSEHMAEAALLLDELALSDARSVCKGASLDVAGLRRLAAPRARNLLRFYLRQRAGVSPSSAYLAEILRQILDSAADAGPRLALGGLELRVFRAKVELVAGRPVDTGVQTMRWSGESRLALPRGGELHARRTAGLGIAAAMLGAASVSVRWRKGGERFHPDGRRPRRTLKNLLQECAVPVWQRDAMPLLYVGDRLVWVPFVGVDHEYRTPPGEAGWSFTWESPGAVPAVG